MCVCARACVCVCAFVFVRVPERAGALMCGLVFFLSKWQPDLIKGNYIVLSHVQHSQCFQVVLPRGTTKMYCIVLLYCAVL